MWRTIVSETLTQMTLAPNMQDLGLLTTSRLCLCVPATLRPATLQLKLFSLGDM